MHKIWLIIQREYWTRVRKKSFLIMTVLGPLLMAATMIVPIWLTTISDEAKTIEVLDETGLFAGKLKNEEDVKFKVVPGPLELAKKHVLDAENTVLLYIPKLDLDKPAGIKLYGSTNGGLKLQDKLEKMLEKEIETEKFARSGLDKAVVEKMQAKVDIGTVNLSETGEKKSNTGVTTIIGLFSGILIYFFIFLYGMQIMNGVIEEKTNRIVEVLISSVKPFQLMMGKIVGVAAVGLTQFLLWIMLSIGIFTFVSSRFQLDRFSDNKIEETMKNVKDVDKAQEMHELMSAMNSLNIPLILGCFLFYFLGGYLLYGALLGAIGSAIDNETDKQQFMLPITIPLILSLVVSQTMIIQNPDGPVAFWMSIIPLTSPISMMMRVPFGVPAWQLVLSMVLLIAGFFFTVWLAGRIYRVGILMYGKKVNYRELSKWLFYKG
ncbi:ABC transporter permease [Adhaeribacter terreus]|uniref:ABC transporter permease n=1 Tax=Adhaeribacter terreus TaxID=529703 RepID=A0ABW0E8K8_9BACT